MKCSACGKPLEKGKVRQTLVTNWEYATKVFICNTEACQSIIYRHNAENLKAPEVIQILPTSMEV